MPKIEPITADEFDSKILRASGPVLLDFYQASCAPCRALEPRLGRVAQQFAGRLLVYRIDIERDLSIADRLNVKSIPTVLVFRNGREISRLDGLITEEQLRQTFETASSA